MVYVSHGSTRDWNDSEIILSLNLFFIDVIQELMILRWFFSLINFFQNGKSANLKLFQKVENHRILFTKSNQQQ